MNLHEVVVSFPVLLIPEQKGTPVLRNHIPKLGQVFLLINFKTLAYTKQQEVIIHL